MSIVTQLAFTDFMAKFLHSSRVADRDQMVTLARSNPSLEAHFATLMKSAEILAGPGLRDSTFDWSGSEHLGARQLVSLALSMLSSNEGLITPADAAPYLSAAQLRSVYKVWLVLYQTALTQIGTSEAARPVDVAEPQQKLDSALEIATLVQEPARETMSLVAKAWLAERTGDLQAATKLKKEAAQVAGMEPGDLPWPPIRREGIVTPSEQ